MMVQGEPIVVVGLRVGSSFGHVCHCDGGMSRTLYTLSHVVRTC